MLDQQMPENEWMRAKEIVFKNGECVENPDNLQREGNFLFDYGDVRVNVYNLDTVAEIWGLEFPERDLMNEERKCR